MQKWPRFPAQQTKSGVTRIDNIRGVNYVDSPVNLVGFAPFAQNVDFSRQPGAAAKRLGSEALFASKGTGGCKGMHTYKHSAGDKVLFGHGTDLYKIAGATSTLTKTSQADFDAGTKTDTRSTTNNDLRLAADGSGSALVDQQNLTSGGTVILGPVDNYGQTFKTGADVVDARGVQIQAGTGWDAETVTCTLYSDASKTSTLGSATATGPYASGDWAAFTFASPIVVVPATTYYFELTTAGTMQIQYNAGAAYGDGAAYHNGVAQAADLTFKTLHSPYKASGTWESPVYDLTNSPISSALSWTVTTPASTSVAFQAKGSQDNSNWGSWQSVAVSGDGIPPARYIKIKATLATTDTTATSILSDFTVTYETAFSSASSIKSGLTGNKIRFAEGWDGKVYFADGTKPHSYDGTTVADITTTTTALTQVSNLCFHKGYIFYVDDSDDSKLYFATAGSVTDIPASNYKQMPNSIKAIHTSFNDALIVSGKGFLAAIYGSVFGTAGDDTTVKYLGTTEAVSQEGIVECVDAENRNILVVLTSGGVKYLVPGLQTQSLEVLPLSRNIQPYFDGAIERQNQEAIFNKQRLLVTLCYNDPGTPATYTNNVVVCYDFKTSQWSGPWPGLNVANFCIATGTDSAGIKQSDEVYIAGSTIGRVYQMFKGTDDAGSNIEYILDTPFVGEVWNKREYKRGRIAVASGSDTDTLTVDFRVDGNTCEKTPGAVSTWNYDTTWPGTWGGEIYGTMDALISPNQMIYQKPGKYLSVRVYDNSANDFILYGIEADYVELQGVV